MSVNVENRTPSEYEYINAYYKVDNDVLALCQNIFGVDKGLITEEQVYNRYHSWRNSLIKDCKYSKKTITSMDNLYKSLFGVYTPQPKLTRDEIIYNLEGGNYKCLM